jgi:hypothetical protein
MNDSSGGPYSRGGQRGPLIIPDSVMSQQQQQQARLGMYPPAHMRGSAENLVEKVWIRVNQTFKAPFLE